MTPAKRSGSSILPTIALLSAICLMGAAVLASVQQKASEANKVYTFTSFAAYSFDLLSALTGEAKHAAMRAANDSDNLEIPGRKPDMVARTEHTRQSLMKAWSRFDRSLYGAQLPRDFSNAVSKLDAVNRIGDARSAGVEDVAARVQSYNMAIGAFIGVVAHIDQLAPSDEQLQHLHALSMRYVNLAQLFSDELALGAARYSGDRPDADSLARWSEVAEKRTNLLKIMDESLPHFQSIAAASAYGETVYLAATSGNSSAMPEFFNWADSMITAVHSALIQASTYVAKMRSLAGRTAITSDRTFTGVTILALILAFLVLCRRRVASAEHRFVILAVLANGAFVVWHLCCASTFISTEDGPLELGQSFALILAIAAFVWHFAKSPNPVRAAALIMAGVCLLMFLRELDIRILGLSERVQAMSDFPGRRLLYYVCAGAIGVYAFLNRHQLLLLVPRKPQLRHWPLYLWPALLILGEIVEYIAHESRDDEVRGYWAAGRFWEELLELNAYALLAFAACTFTRIVQARTASRRG